MDADENKKYFFGEKLRTVREKKHLTLKSVAEKADVSESLVSQIERNKVSPAIDTLLDIADALDISLEFLFEEFSRNRHLSVVHEFDRRKINEEHVIYEEVSDPFSGAGENSFESYIIRIPPKAKTRRGNFGHLGKEMGVVLNGEGILHYGNREIKIAEGDSVTFNASSPHFIENVCDTEFDAIWMVTPAQKFNT
jgi:transcriptional regulator with XRE-family HTH domain